MKRLLAAMCVVLAVAIPAAAEVRSIRVCQDKTLSASTTTDCTYTDISACKFFSYQIYCGETTGNSMSISVDWIGGSSASSAQIGIPILTTGSAMTQLKTDYTAEDAWSVLASIQPPVSPVGTLRFTEKNADADIVCTAVLNCGN